MMLVGSLIEILCKRNQYPLIHSVTVVKPAVLHETWEFYTRAWRCIFSLDVCALVFSFMWSRGVGWGELGFNYLIAIYIHMSYSSPLSRYIKCVRQQLKNKPQTCLLLLNPESTLAAPAATVIASPYVFAVQCMAVAWGKRRGSSP